MLDAFVRFGRFDARAPRPIQKTIEFYACVRRQKLAGVTSANRLTVLARGRCRLFKFSLFFNARERNRKQGELEARRGEAGRKSKPCQVSRFSLAPSSLPISSPRAQRSNKYTRK